MNGADRIPRSRGGTCGILLILLGLWAGLAPFAGPYFHFGYTPDLTWRYSSGRLYFTIIPAAAAVVGGLLALATRHRGVGSTGGLLGILGGAWLVGGVSFAAHVLHRSYPIGAPIAQAGLTGQALSLRQYLEQVALFTGVGLLLVLTGAVAMGRFSMVSARDVGADVDDRYPDFAVMPPAATRGFPTATTAQYPPEPTWRAGQAGEPYYPAQSTVPGAPDQFPSASTSTFPAQQDEL